MKAEASCTHAYSSKMRVKAKNCKPDVGIDQNCQKIVFVQGILNFFVSLRYTEKL